MAETETNTQAPAGTMVLAFCPDCDAAFLKHDGRPWSPCHAVEPVNEIDLNELIDGFILLSEALGPVLEFVAQHGADALRALLASVPTVPAAAASSLAADSDAEAPEGGHAAPPADAGAAETPVEGASPQNASSSPAADSPGEEPAGAVGPE